MYGSNSRAKLKITRSMLTEILTFHQVMPQFLDFMLIFGLQSHSRDLGFSNFCEQVSIQKNKNVFHIERLGRSGRQYQLCYNLKGVTLKSPDSKNPTNQVWSIRQAAFYHRFDVVGGNTLWILTKGGTDLDSRFKELTGRNAQPEHRSFENLVACFKSSLSTHLLWCHWSTEDWRGYLRWLEYLVDNEVARFLNLILSSRLTMLWQTGMAVLGSNEHGNYHRRYTTTDVQRLVTQEERIGNAATMLESNVEVISALNKFYCRLGAKKTFTMANTCREDINDFSNELENVINNLKLQIGRAKALMKIVSGRLELVKQHRLERLNRHMEKEAIVVRIITIVTLLYLPATFTSVSASNLKLSHVLKILTGTKIIHSHSSAQTWSSIRTKDLRAIFRQWP